MMKDLPETIMQNGPPSLKEKVNVVVTSVAMKRVSETAAPVIELEHKAQVRARKE